MGNICYNLEDSNSFDQRAIFNQMIILNKVSQHEEKEQKQVKVNHQVKIISPKEQQIQLPKLSFQVLQTLEKYNFYAKELENNQSKLIHISDCVYVGSINSSNQPHGYGKIYKNNGELYIGEFKNGKTQGRGVYILQNGAYYKGEFSDNKASCRQGYYQSPQLKYSGSIKNNVFQGKGIQEGQKYIFQGKFVNGKKFNGKLIWRDENGFTFFYNGCFNENEKFHGKGVLVQYKGTYEGEFVNGVKQGNGYYKGINGIKYRGTYKNGLKEGFGTIYNNDESIAYKGEMKNGLPHGKGETYINGKVNQTEWVDGIDKQVLYGFKNHQ